MRLLADENIRRSMVLALRGAGHDVAWVREAMAGAADEAIVAIAKSLGGKRIYRFLRGCARRGSAAATAASSSTATAASAEQSR